MPIPRRLFLAAPLLAAPALAQPAWPDRPVRIVVPYPPGGGLDALARALADRLTPVWKQTVTVDNRPGGATIPGTDAVAKAQPDGHVLLMTSDASVTANPHMHARLPHDPMRDLVPVSYLLDVHQMVLVHPGVAVRDMAGLVSAARARPGALNYGSYGPGSQPHLLFEALKAREGLEITQVAYRGLTPAVLATVAGEVQGTLAGVASAREFLATGQLRALAVGRPARLPQLPDVPTLIEAGYPEIDPRTWFGLFAPAGTPPALLARTQRDVAAALEEPVIRDRHLTPNGYTVHAATPEASVALVAADFEAKRELVRVSKARVD
ncbi:tripartite tricarboxylate transporter substrate binding protein [Roseomonas sp. SSH11]|uniref:Tripartite tricarboxylate transporter substrate binding protein n=1 Tax=Pararoseomonas baculiformis TaxID=2820812 RepID=A0ABS4ACG0_9PROT|nr:tripartite tricarboxylate transporter substrate binding protein [Pararoseomonas baculiformis]MBP0444690.1 tripartite tricarboxylate transporter substrate binding protein [Pararoseomonas baculiformis]